MYYMIYYWFTLIILCFKGVLDGQLSLAILVFIYVDLDNILILLLVLLVLVHKLIM